MSTPPKIPGAPNLWRIGDSAPPKGAFAAIVPGTLAPLMPLGLPEKLRGTAREKVAERQLVEQLSTQASEFEFHPAHPIKGRVWDSAIVPAKSDIENWRKKAIKAKAILPDYFTLPATAETWTIDTTGEVASVRIGVDDGFSAEAELAVAMLQDLQKPKAVLRIGPSDVKLDGLLKERGIPVYSDAKAFKKAGFRILNWNNTTLGMDLANPPHAAMDVLVAQVRPWVGFVFFILLALAIFCAMLWTNGSAILANAAQDRDRAIGLVREHFVPAGPILDIRAQVTATMESKSVEPEATETGLTPLQQFQLIAPFFISDDIKVEAISYRTDTGLVAQILAADFASLDAIIADLQTANYLVEQLEARTAQSGGIFARLRLEPLL